MNGDTVTLIERLECGSATKEEVATLRELVRLLDPRGSQLTEAEWEDATTGSNPLMRGYRPAHYDYAFDYRTVSYDGQAID